MIKIFTSFNQHNIICNEILENEKSQERLSFHMVNKEQIEKETLKNLNQLIKKTLWEKMFKKFGFKYKGQFLFNDRKSPLTKKLNQNKAQDSKNIDMQIRHHLYFSISHLNFIDKCVLALKNINNDLIGDKLFTKEDLILFGKIIIKLEKYINTPGAIGIFVNKTIINPMVVNKFYNTINNPIVLYATTNPIFKNLNHTLKTTGFSFFRQLKTFSLKKKTTVRLLSGICLGKISETNKFWKDWNPVVMGWIGCASKYIDLVFQYEFMKYNSIKSNKLSLAITGCKSIALINSWNVKKNFESFFRIHIVNFLNFFIENKILKTIRIIGDLIPCFYIKKGKNWVFGVEGTLDLFGLQIILRIKNIFGDSFDSVGMVDNLKTKRIYSIVISLRKNFKKYIEDETNKILSDDIPVIEIS